MQEIKFRAWDKENRVMVYSDDNANDDYAFIIEKNGLEFYYIDNDRHLMDTNSIKMQYTGLKDKNGEEIYEGDIVSTEDGCFEGTTCGIVTEYKGMFTSFYGQDALGREQYDELHTVSGEREVIGNIYENPELLEGATDGSS